MKKFLTVLLALSVVFTYTVGTAFAAAPDAKDQMSADQVRSELANAYTTAVKDLDKAMNTQLDDYFGNETTTTGAHYWQMTISKAAAEAVMKSEIYANAKAEIDARYYDQTQKIENLIADKDFVAFSTVAVNAEDEKAYPLFDKSKYTYSDLTNISFDLKSSWELQNKIAVKEFELVKKDAEEHVAAIDLGVYSKETAKGQTESNYEVASKLATKAATAIANITVNTEMPLGPNDPAPSTSAMEGIAAIRAIYTPAVGLANPTGALYVGTGDYAPGLNNISKLSDAETEAADLAYAKDKVLSTILKGLTEDKDAVVDAYQVAIRVENSKAKPNADTIADYNSAIADTKAAYDAAVATVKYVVENCTKVEELGSFDAENRFHSGWAYVAKTADTYAGFKATKVTQNTYKSPVYVNGVITIADCENNADLVAVAEKEAEKAKAYIDLDGDMAVQIEEALEETIDTIYTTGAGKFEVPTMYTIVAERIKALLGEKGNTVKVGTKTYDTVKVWKSMADVNKGYDESMFDEIRAIADETKAAVKAAKTVEEADAAFLAGYAKFDAVATSSEHAAMFNTLTGALKADYETYIKSLRKIASGIEAVEVGGDDFKYLATGELKDTFVNAVANEMKTTCYTTDELKVLYDEAVATLNNLKTDEQLKTEKAAVIALIKALPATVTLADKDAVLAAKDAIDNYEEYINAVGANPEHAILGSDAAYKTALNAKVNAIDALEKDAIADAYAPLNTKYVAKKLTLADKDAVEALRAAVDAYVAERTTKDMSNTAIAAIESSLNVPNLENIEDEIANLQVEAVIDMIARLDVNNIDAAAVKAAREAFDGLPEGYGIDQKSYDKLVALEKVVAEKAIKAVESMKVVKAHSAAGKGYIKVMWDVVGDEAAIDGFQVYKSTKAQSGYTFMGKTTKHYMTNKKGLKKGKRFYYKVRAYKVIDGTKYFSDWSNKANRIAK